jgi:hypothetical protein
MQQKQNDKSKNTRQEAQPSDKLERNQLWQLSENN